MASICVASCGSTDHFFEATDAVGVVERGWQVTSAGGTDRFDDFVVVGHDVDFAPPSCVALGIAQIAVRLDDQAAAFSCKRYGLFHRCG